MKRFSVCLLIVTIILTTAPSGLAQRNDPPEIRELRANIKRMEGMQVNKLAPAMLEIYKKTLLGFYEELLRYVQQQIDGTAAAHARESLNQQKAQLLDNIAILRMSLGVQDRSSVEQTNPRPAADAPLAADTSAVPSPPTTNPEAARTPVATTPEPAPSTATKQPVALSNAVTTTPQPAAPSTAVKTTTVTASANPTTTATATAVATASCDYSKVAPILKDAAQRLAQGILFQPGPPSDQVQQIDSDVNKLVFYALADTLNIQVAGDPGKPPITIADLEPYHYLGETVRTDKQLGASSSSSAAVSRIDKAGFAWLLGLGIENGLVEKDVRDTVLTLSTSPAALYVLDRNAPNPYRKAGILNRIGVSASFNISNQDQLLANATRSQLREYSVKYRFAGDRSPRSNKLERIWDDVAPAIQQRLIALNRAAIFMDTDPVLNPLVAKANAQLQDRVLALLTSDSFKQETDKTKREQSVTGEILCYLLGNVYTQKNNVSQAVVAQFTNVLVPNLVSADGS